MTIPTRGKDLEKRIELVAYGRVLPKLFVVKDQVLLSFLLIKMYYITDHVPHPVIITPYIFFHNIMLKIFTFLYLSPMFLKKLFLKYIFTV